MAENKTGNLTTTETYYYYYYYYDYCSQDHLTDNDKEIIKAAGALLWTLVVVIIVLNAYLLAVLYRRKVKRSRLHYFICHLAIADLFVGLTSVFEDALERSIGQWLAGEVMCKIIKTVISVPYFASNNLLISLSIDRFVAVAYPLKFVTIGTKLDKALVGGAWAVAIILSAPGLWIYGVNECFDCDLYYITDTREIYFISFLILVYLMPFVILSMIYTAITFIIWKAYRAGVNRCSSGSLTATSQDQPNRVDDMSRSKPTSHGVAAGVLPKAKIRSVKMTLIICIAFMLCWGPYCILNALAMFEISSPSYGTFEMMQVIYAFNSVVNPVIFMLFNVQLFWKQKHNSECDEDENDDKNSTKATKTSRLRNTIRLAEK